MTDPASMTTAVTKLDISITIPATGSPAKISALLAQSVKDAIGLNPQVAQRARTCVGGKILATGSPYKWGTAGAAVTVPVTGTEIFNEPAADFLDTYVASDATAIGPVVAVLYLAS